MWITYTIWICLTVEFCTPLVKKTRIHILKFMRAAFHQDTQQKVWSIVHVYNPIQKIAEITFTFLHYKFTLHVKFKEHSCFTLTLTIYHTNNKAYGVPQQYIRPLVQGWELALLKMFQERREKVHGRYANAYSVHRKLSSRAFQCSWVHKRVTAYLLPASLFVALPPSLIV